MGRLNFWQKVEIISDSVFSFCFGMMSFLALLFMIALMVKTLTE